MERVKAMGVGKRDDAASVLFLCTRNSCRSQLAEALLRSLSGGRINVFSAGLEPSEVNPLVPVVLGEIGVDHSGLRSKNVREFLGRKSFAFLITVCAKAEGNCPTTFPGVGKKLCWAFEDPDAFEGTEEARLEKFRQVRDLIASRLREWLEEGKIDFPGRKEG